MFLRPQRVLREKWNWMQNPDNCWTPTQPGTLMIVSLWCRLSSSRNSGRVREETLNCECLPSVGSALPSPIVFSESLFADLCYWTRLGLSQQARQSQKASLHPEQQYSSFENKHSRAVSVSMFPSFSSLWGSNTSAAIVPIRRSHSSAKHETEAWGLKINPVIALMDPESISQYQRQLIWYAAEMMNSGRNTEFIVSNLSCLLSNSSLRAIKLVSTDFLSPLAGRNV